MIKEASAGCNGGKRHTASCRREATEANDMNCIYRFAVFPIRWIRKFRNGTHRRGACAELLFYVAQLYTLYWILCIIHTETYVFQSTALGDIFRPVRRTKCSLVPHTLNEFNGDGRHDTKKPQSRDRKIRRHLGNTRSSQHSPTNSSVSRLWLFRVMPSISDRKSVV